MTTTTAPRMALVPSSPTTMARSLRTTTPMGPKRLPTTAAPSLRMAAVLRPHPQSSPHTLRSHLMGTHSHCLTHHCYVLQLLQIR